MLNKWPILMLIAVGFLTVTAGCTDLCDFLGLEDPDCANLLASFASSGGSGGGDDRNGDSDGDHDGDHDDDQDGDHDGDNHSHNGDADAGATVFAANCAACHGADGSGGTAHSIRGEHADDVWERINGHNGHNAFPDLTQTDADNIAAFLAQ